MITDTPRVIKQAWNDGLYTLRAKRNGTARGTTIEEKVMFVLGLGWKHKGSSEVKDSEIENTLYISLQGLTADAKLLKIGQVLWEQCDNDFIYKMISSMSNNTPTTSAMFKQIEREQQRNYKGYFSRTNNKRINRNKLDPKNILDKERTQRQSNLTMNSRMDKLRNDEMKNLKASQVNSKSFNRQMVKYKAPTKELKQLAMEVEIALKTIQEFKINLIPMAAALNIPIESGYSKNFIIEEMKARIVTYVAMELIQATPSSSKNVYIRVSTMEGINVIKKVLSYTSMAILALDENITADQMANVYKNKNTMKANWEVFGGRKDKDGKTGNISQRKLNKKVNAKDTLMGKITKAESSGNKVKTDEKSLNSLWELLETNFGGREGKRVYFFDASEADGSNQLTAGNAMARWSRTKDIQQMSKNTTTGEALAQSRMDQSLLVFEGYNDTTLMEQMMIVASSMGIGPAELTKAANDKKNNIEPSSYKFFLLSILRRHFAMQKAGNKWLGLFNRHKKLKDHVMTDIQSNISNTVKAKEAEAAKRTEVVEVADGVFMPVTVDSGQLMAWKEKMQPVYVMGGSIYTFGQGGVGQSGSVKKEEIEDAVKKRGRALNRLMKGTEGKNANRGAFGSKEPEFMGLDVGEYETRLKAEGYSDEEIKKLVAEEGNNPDRRFIEGKIYPELIGKFDKVNMKELQPVFITNKGLNVSSIETTALLNLLPQILNAIPLVGAPAAMAVDALLQGEIDAAKNLPKFAKGGSFTTNNSNVSQFIAGDSINNRINPERITVDWASQRVNVQPIGKNNNVANVETGRISDPIMGNTPTVRIKGDQGGTDAVVVHNAVNPFGEEISMQGGSARPIDLLISVASSLADITGVLLEGNQLSANQSVIAAKAVDQLKAIGESNSKGTTSSGGNIFGPISSLARGE